MRVGFGRFIFDSGLRELLVDGQPAHLPPKAFDVLQMLLEHRPNVVGKQEIYSAIWPNTFVVDATLTVVIADIRRALDDDPKAPTYIRTAHRVGYAFFFAPVVDLTAEPLRAASFSRCWLVQNERAFPLEEGESIVGRDPRCTVWLDESGVSRRHARIVVAGTSVTIEDLGSKNGTFVRNRRVDARRELGDGDMIRFGSTAVKVRVWSEAEPPETARVARKRGERHSPR
jgi:DNA-binding winged helix-turn-helix (wHTH) protein